MKISSLCFIAFSTLAATALTSQELSDRLKIEKDPLREPEPQTLDSFLSEFDGAYISRPAGHAGAYESIIVDFKVDGFAGQHMTLKGPVALKGSVPHDWQQDPAMSSRFGIALRNRYATEMVMGFTVFKRSTFLPDTKTEGVISYLAGLKNIYRDRLQLNDMPLNFRDQGFMAHLLGRETLHIDYTIQGRIDESSATRYFTYLILVDENWVEITLFGPEDQFDNFIPPFQRFLRNYSIVQNDAEAFGQSR